MDRSHDPCHSQARPPAFDHRGPAPDNHGRGFSGFRPETVAPFLDYISVHIYPEKGKVNEAMATLQQFAVGKPVVVEETFPLSCSGAELREFLLGSRQCACGWMGHYSGESISKLEALR